MLHARQASVTIYFRLYLLLINFLAAFTCSLSPPLCEQLKYSHATVSHHFTLTLHSSMTLCGGFELG